MSENSQCSTQRSDHHPVCLEWHEETEQTETKGHYTLNPKFSRTFFSYSSSFPIKMFAMNAKTQKIEPDPNFVMTDESFGGSV